MGEDESAAFAPISVSSITIANNDVGPLAIDRFKVCQSNGSALDFILSYPIIHWVNQCAGAQILEGLGVVFLLQILAKLGQGSFLSWQIHPY